MREFWRRPKRFTLGGKLLLVFAFSARPLLAEFDQTTGTQTDSKNFNGMSQEEVEGLQRLQNAYLTEVYKRIKKFDEGDKSSKFDGQGAAGGRYSGYGEAHIQLGDAMISHEAGANALEAAVEKGALGQTGLSGQARLDAEKKEIEKNTAPLQAANGVYQKDAKGNELKFKNNTTQEMQAKCFEISGALYDAGSAHGDANDPHRIYGLKNEVRTEVEKNGAKYASKTVADATLAPGKQANLDLLHKSYSKMEQDKYIMMATDAFAFRSARLEGTDTSDRNNRFTIGEYKQIAIDAYARNPGNITAAETEIKAALTSRVAEKRVLTSASLCPDGKVEGPEGCRPTAAPGAVATEPEYSRKDRDALADAILLKLGAESDGVKREALLAQMNIRAVDPQLKNGDDKIGTLSSAMKGLNLKQLSGIVKREKLDQLYAEAKQNLKPEDLARIAEYKARMDKNNCLNFRKFCYAPGAWASLDKKDKDAAQAPAAGTAAAAKSKIAADDYQEVTGDPGGYFNDTREMLFNNFAYAYNRPLAEWKGIVTNLDFNEKSDDKIKTGNFAKGQDGQVRDGKLYKEFNQMYTYALDQAKNIQQNVDNDFVARLRSAGATPAQIAQIQKNYGVDGKNNFDATQNSIMKLFGQNKDRDAVVMDWRKGGNNKFIDPTVRQDVSRTPTSRTFPPGPSGAPAPGPAVTPRR